MNRELQELKNKNYSGVKELAEEAERILDAIGADQIKGSVREYPTERTVRFYITERLLPEPLGKEGTTSIFGYEHLVALLAIKKLQSQRLPISVIRTMLQGRDTAELEKLLDEELLTFTDAAELDRYRESVGHTDDSDVMMITDPAARDEYLQNIQTPNKAKEYLESLLPGRGPERPDASLPLYSASPTPPPPSARAPKRPRVVRKYEVARGLEMTVDEKFRPPRDLNSLLQEIAKILRDQ